MGHTLKLDIYYFSFKRIKETVERKVRGGEIRTGYITGEQDIRFDQLFHNLYGKSDADENFKAFLFDFARIFDNKFKKNKQQTKAVSLSDDLEQKFNASNYTIWGQFKGGATGELGQEIYVSNNAKDKTIALQKDDVVSILYFYKIWIPYDSNTGVLMIQSYTEETCALAFREKIEDFFISRNFKPEWGKFMPKEYVNKYLSDCYIYSLQIVRKIITKKKEGNVDFLPEFSSFNKARKKKVIDNIRISMEKLMSLKDYISILKSQIIALDENFDEEKEEVLLYYNNKKDKNQKAKKAHAKLSNIDTFPLTITLDDSLKEEMTQRPKWEELHKYTNEILEDIKKEMEYTPMLIK